jgi:predicted polyphosphate/ATP-dependent NAD kinase
MSPDAATSATVGFIANPVSARDIRRVIANASSLQVADRTNIVLRALTALAATGVERVLVMPDRKGIRAMLERAVTSDRNLGRSIPAIEFLDMAVTSTVDDTHVAACRMAERGVAAIIVLGGDGTHRAVVSTCGEVPIAGLSTGTNNAYPELRESTITGLAVGLHATGMAPSEVAVALNKVLDVSVDGGLRQDLALVDVVASTDRYVGARALWRMESIIELFVTFADPEAIGMSAIAGALHPIDRMAPNGLHVTIDQNSPQRVLAAIGPGMVEPVGVGGWEPIDAGTSRRVSDAAGTLALDGERELEMRPGEVAEVTLRRDGFRSIDVGGVMRWAASTGVLREAAERVEARERDRKEDIHG